MTAFARALGQSWRFDRATLRSVVIFGLCQNGLYLGLNFLAMQKIEASLAAIIASAMPLIVALLAWVLRGERMGAMGIAGLVAGFVGVALVMGSRMSGGADGWMVLACVIAAAALAVATLTVGSASKGGNLLMIVMFSGYESFISKMDIKDHEDLPEWLGKVDFAALKIKLVASIVAISGIHLLKVFMEIDKHSDREIQWMVIIHVVFIFSGLLLAAMDRLSMSGKH